MTMPVYDPGREIMKASFDRAINNPLGDGPNPNGDEEHQEGAIVWMAIAAVEFVALLGWFCMWVFS